VNALLNRLPPGLRRLFLYGLCGGSGAALDFAVYAALIHFMGVWYQAANIAGYICGTLLSFVLNRAITFQVMDAPWRRLATFFAVAGVGYLSSSATLWLLVERAHMNELLAKIAALVVVVAVQFTLNSLITFRTRATPETAS